MQNHDIGWFAEAGNLEAIAATFTEIANTDISELKKRSEHARALAENEYSKEIILEKYKNLFKYQLPKN